MKKPKRNKIRTNREYCPECLKDWADCNCDELYPEPDLIRLNDQYIEDSFNTY